MSTVLLLGMALSAMLAAGVVIGIKRRKNQ